MKVKNKPKKREAKARRVAHAAAPIKPTVSQGRSAHVNPGNGKRSKVTPVAPLISAPTRPRYGQNLHYGAPGLRYVLLDAEPTGKAKVKLELASRTDANLVGFGHAHDEAITGNPNFVTPQPTKAVFDAKLTELEGILAELENHRVIGKGLTDQRDLVRAEFELLFTQRGTYVELASGGDAAIITSAGLPVRNAPTPMGVLHFPGNLRVDLNGVAGEMTIRYQAVTGAKSYMLEMAEVVNGQIGEFNLIYMGGKLSRRLPGMTIGKTYAFRVAAVGGEGGRSAWSPVVLRAAA